MADANRLTVMTFNIRYDEESDGQHVWRNRRSAVIDTIRAHDPDLLGLQEPDGAQWRELAAGLPVLSGFGAPGVDPEDRAPHGGFFRTGRFRTIDSGVFWLSETPSVPDSVSWPNDWGARACGWIKLQDERAGQPLVFASTHVDTNAGAWLPSAQALHRQLDAVAGDLPVVLVGDFNCAAGSEAHAICERSRLPRRLVGRRQCRRRGPDVQRFHAADPFCLPIRSRCSAGWRRFQSTRSRKTRPTCASTAITGSIGFCCAATWPLAPRSSTTERTRACCRAITIRSSRVSSTRGRCRDPARQARANHVCQDVSSACDHLARTCRTMVSSSPPNQGRDAAASCP